MFYNVERKFRVGQIANAVDFIIETLTSHKVQRKRALRCALECEEILAVLMESAEEGAEVSVSVAHRLDTTVTLKCKGEPCEVVDPQINAEMDALDGEDAEAQSVIRNLLLKNLGGNISSKHIRGTNIVRLTEKVSDNRQLILTLGGMLCGALLGLLLQLIGWKDVTTFLCEKVFSSVTTLFMNAVKMIVTPLVFFSICASVAGFGDLKALGKAGARVFASYLVTSCVAVILGISIFSLFPVGDPSLVSAVNGNVGSYVESAQSETVSIIGIIVNIIPANFIKAFYSADMLQIIFLAVLLGISVGRIGKASAGVRSFLDTANSLFSEATAIIIRFLPVSAFCAMANMTAKMGLVTIARLLPWLAEVYIGCLLMVVVYMILILVIGRKNPLPFLRKFSPAMLTAYSMGSSNAALPSSMEICGKRLGIDKRLYSFSLPLGATVNMDGGCVFQIISALFMARIFGVQMDGSVLMTLIVTVLVLSVGAPGVPGANMVCVAMLLPQIGVPMEAISLIIGLYPLAGSILTMVNVTGDAAVTTVTAAKSGQLDSKIYDAR